MQSGAGNQEDVLGARAQRIDLRGVQIDVVGREHARDARQQSRPVARDDRQHLIRAFVVGLYVHVGRNREMAQLAIQARIW